MLLSPLGFPPHPEHNSTAYRGLRAKKRLATRLAPIQPSKPFTGFVVRRQIILPIAALLLLLTCISLSWLVTSPSAPPTSDKYTLTLGSLELGAFRPLTYASFMPKQVHAQGPVVILAHGLLRNKSSMEGWASQWAAQGIPVVSVDLVRLGLPQSLAEKNAQDLLALKQHLNIKNPIYAGFSSGGLSALLAASEDPETKAVMLFDPAEVGGLAAEASKQLAVPISVFVSPGHFCNAHGQGGLALQTHPQAQVISVPAASHCWFEQPYSKLCAMACGEGDGTVREQGQKQLIQQSKNQLQKWQGHRPNDLSQEQSNINTTKTTPAQPAGGLDETN